MAAKRSPWALIRRAALPALGMLIIANFLGYAVLEASDTVAAIEILANKPPIDLLFTDVVLPGGLNGRTLADEVRRKYPGLPVLFTTGYTRNAIVHQGRLDPGVSLLNKPYRLTDLAEKIHGVLHPDTD